MSRIDFHYWLLRVLVYVYGMFHGFTFNMSLFGLFVSQPMEEASLWEDVDGTLLF